MYLLEYISCFCFIEKLLTQDLSFPPKGNKHTHTYTHTSTSYNSVCLQFQANKLKLR